MGLWVSLSMSSNHRQIHVCIKCGSVITHAHLNVYILFISSCNSKLSQILYPACVSVHYVRNSRCTNAILCTLLRLHFQQTLVKQGARYIRPADSEFPIFTHQGQSIREALRRRHRSALGVSHCHGSISAFTGFDISSCSLGGLHLYLQSSEILLMSDLRGLSRYQ